MTPFAVVVNWNGGEAVLACVRSLVAEGLPEDHVILVDNASTDGSADAVAAGSPGVVVLRNAVNTGFGHGTNQGIERALQAGAERVLLVNDDVTLSSGALALLGAELDAHAEVGVVGPRVVYAADPGTIWCAGGRMTWRQNLSTMIGHGRPDGERYRRTLDVDYVPGCAMLVRRGVFDRIGLFEGDYFAYHEDVEFCLLARQAGFGVRVVGRALALHDAHRSTGGGYNRRRKYMMGLNTVWFLRRHGTPGRWLSFAVFDVLALPFVWLARFPRGEGGAVLAKARGTWDGIRGKRVTPESVQER